MWVSETFWHWHSLYRRARSLGPVGSSHVEYSRRVHDGGGGVHTASWVFCRVEPEPMPGTDRTNQGRAQASSMHANQPVRGARVEGNCRGSLPWIQQQQQSHSITWAGKPGGRNMVSWRRRHEARWPSVTSLLLRTVKGWSKSIDTFFFLGGLVAEASSATAFDWMKEKQDETEKTRTFRLMRRRKNRNRES